MDLILFYHLSLFFEVSILQDQFSKFLGFLFQTKLDWESRDILKECLSLIWCSFPPLSSFLQLKRTEWHRKLNDISSVTSSRYPYYISQSLNMRYVHSKVCVGIFGPSSQDILRPQVVRFGSSNSISLAFLFLDSRHWNNVCTLKVRSTNMCELWYVLGMVVV
jgi:hypothetical protein